MKKPIIVFLALFTLMACRPKKFTYSNISNYTIDTDALKDQELVSVIYFSGGPDHNNDQKYYYRYIVVSESTGDTVNVLCSVMHEIDPDNPIKRFIDPNAENAITVDKLMELAQRTQGKGNYEKYEIKKVINNRQFKKAEDNHYPYIIGMLAEFDALE